MTDEGGRPWVAAHEGWYGPPLAHADRLDLVAWLGAQGFDGYAYSPKDDAHHRERWREPYPDEAMGRFAELHRACTRAGIDLVLMVSPGLDWRQGDPSEVEALAAKLTAFADLGVRSLSINWDDVPGRGAADGAEHGGAVAEVVARVDEQTDGPIAWMACPVDYAAAEPTAYLAAFAAALPDDVVIGWTGASVVARGLTTGEVHGLEGTLGRRLAFCENFPVNDLGMAEVLHLGPYPRRDPALAQEPRRVLVNFMHRVEASRPGLLAAERFWHGGPPGDRSPDAAASARADAWLEIIRGIEGLEPLARACWSWVADPEPDPELVEWATAALDGDDRLERFLRAGCRVGLAPALAAEVAPWLDQWDAEATAMLAALDLLALGRTPSVARLWTAAQLWDDARCGRPQVFGIRFARYPMTRRESEHLVADRGAVVHGTNLTDRLWAAVLDQLGC